MGGGRLFGALAALALAATSAGCGSDSDGPGSGGATGGEAASGGSSSGGSSSGATSGSGGSDGVAGASGGGGTTTGGASGKDGASCKVDDVVYPHGATGVPDAASCNTCQCTDGQLAACTKIACPNSCPRNQDFGTQCAECGPVDECLVVEHGCFEVCDVDTCRDGVCNDGVCVQLCG